VRTPHYFDQKLIATHNFYVSSLMLCVSARRSNEAARVRVLLIKTKMICERTLLAQVIVVLNGILFCGARSPLLCRDLNFTSPSAALSRRRAGAEHIFFALSPTEALSSLLLLSFIASFRAQFIISALNTIKGRFSARVLRPAQRRRFIIAELEHKKIEFGALMIADV
jgi:hypothetical protein